MNTDSFLPTEKRAPKGQDPRLTIIYGPPKAGKTTLISTLPNNLIMDLEEGTHYLNALAINIIGWDAPTNETEEDKKIRREENKFYIIEIGREIIKQGKPYDFITIDTATELEEMIMPIAVQLYKDTPMGSNFQGDDVRDLPRGSGYLYLRIAFKDCLNRLKKLANNIILIAHLKDTFVTKAGKEVQARELALTGKIKEITCAGADAIGYLHWGDNGAMLLNFKSSDELLCGSRCDHLRGKEIQIATFNETTNQLENVDWSLIFPNTFHN